jgi:peptidoglycan hydrolase CwlO-like protein
VETFASTVFAEQANHKLKVFFEQTSRQTHELEENEEKLRNNLEELMAAQEESVRREDELIKLAEESATREEILGQEIDALKEQIAQMSQNTTTN